MNISSFLRGLWRVSAGDRLVALVFLGAMILSLIPTSLVFAATYKGYGGKVDKANVNLTMTVGESQTVVLTFMNTGDKTWKRGIGNGQVSLDVVGTQPSPLKDASWINGEVPEQLRDATVPPGKSTTVTFRVKATKAGTYSETFRLAANGVAWMRDAETKVTITATASGSSASASTSSVSGSATTPVASGTSYSATLLLKPRNGLSLAGGDSATVTYGFKNTGNAVWKTVALKLSNVYAASTGIASASVRHSSWPTTTQTPTLETGVKPGEIGLLAFTLQAPAKRGSYTAKFALVADGNLVDGITVDIPITVTADGAYQLDPPIVPTTSSNSSVIGQSPEFRAEEPIIRVGLFRTTDDRMMVRGVSGPYRVFQGDKTVCSMAQSDVVTIAFDRTNLVYKLSGPNCKGQSSTPYQIQRTDGEWEALEMTDFSRPVSWLPGANDNTFRGILELRYAADDPDHDVWTVNELPMEYYLYGIGETSNSSPLEYQKALLIAARTYGYYHWSRGTKHETRGFQIDGKYDQVYRGYGSEIRSPNIVQGVKDTRGQIVTYEGKLAITPYFSRSDGRTRSWGEVWYGGSNYPWLVTVPVPQDSGRTLWGHGVGMSATGALGMANEGSDYVSILKHFYTGIDLLRYY